MTHIHRPHRYLHLARRNFDNRPLEIDAASITHAILRRAESSDSSSNSSTRCGPDDNTGVCEKPTSSGNKLPIILGALIPLVCAVVVLIYLHRRHVRKVKQEDANDKHNSLDFGTGTDGLANGKKGRYGAEMSLDGPEKGVKITRGLSMDMAMSSPYLLPARLNGSRESFHSLSRTAHDGEDPYRPVALMKGDDASMRSVHTAKLKDNSSVLTGSTGYNENMNLNLLLNAQSMPQSMPRTAPDSPINSRMVSQPPSAPQPAYSTQHLLSQRDELGLPPDPHARDSYLDHNVGDLRRSNNYLTDFIQTGNTRKDASFPNFVMELPTSSDLFRNGNDTVEPPQPALKSPAIGSAAPVPAKRYPLRKQSVGAAVPPHAYSQSVDNEDSYYVEETVTNYGNSFRITPPSPTHDTTPQIRYSVDTSPYSYEDPVENNDLVKPPYNFDQRRMSMGIRPLPPEDPTDNPEQRANRIRSFYKEYFDESKSRPMGRPDIGHYDEDYAHEYRVVAPFAEPIPRRAMTPPPRAPPRFMGQSGVHNYNGSIGGSIGPRTISSLSNRYAGGQGPQRKKLQPPPAPLVTLPTPHRLKEDCMVFNPIDFAPPATFRDQQAGRPNSPLGVSRPYSPTVRAHTPLVSSFDDLAVIPSPHHLRKSCTFTALDFAAPPRFKNADAASDAGSIRSNRSGISAVQLHSLRAGAYRVSRIPKEIAGTKAELNDALRPKMDLRNLA